MLRRMSNAVDSLGEVVGRLPDMGVQTIRVAEGSRLVGKKLSGTDLRPKYGLTVVAVMRKKEIFPSPGPDFAFQADDIV